ncbi:MAG: alpha-hydroxy acid oxidase, partial [Planctomycetota bacterium]
MSGPNRNASLLRTPLGFAHRYFRKYWERRLEDCYTISDIEKQFRRRIPPVVGDYFFGAASDEVTLRENAAAFAEMRFNPSYGIRHHDIDLTTTIAGTPISMPILAGPIGSLRTVWPDGECIAAKVAGQLGTICTLSTLTGTPLEDVASAAEYDCWFQLYLVGGQKIAKKGIQRAWDAGYKALVLTIDTPVAGLRFRDKRNGSVKAISGGLLQKMRFAPQMSMHLSWLADHYYDGGLMDFPNIVFDDGESMQYADIGRQLQQSAVTWEDLEWIREIWPGKLIVKGIHNANDALRAAEIGATAVIVSNHGG